MITEQGKPFMLGATATNIISLTENQGVMLHLDTDDGGLAPFIFAGRTGPVCLPATHY